MNPIETANNLMNGCKEPLAIKSFKFIAFGTNITDISPIPQYGNFDKTGLCPSCKSIIRTARECWQEELEFLDKTIREYNDNNLRLEEETHLRIMEIQQALKITESVQ